MVACKMLFDHEKKEWKRLNLDDPRVKEEPRVIDIGEKLTNTAWKIKKRLHKDFDFAVIITGEVGSGKSNLGRCLARLVSDENFHPETHVVKTAHDIKKVFKKAKKYEAVIFDEGSLVFSSTNSLTKETKYANAVLDVCRQRNLLLIIIAPKFHRIGASVAVERTKMMLYTYITQKGQRGPYKVFGETQKEKLYYFAKRDPKMAYRIRPKWKGWCHEDKTYTKEYKKMKDQTYDDALEMFSRPKTDKESRKEGRREMVRNFLRNNKKLKAQEIADMFSVSKSTIDRYIGEIKKEREKEE